MFTPVQYLVIFYHIIMRYIYYIILQNYTVTVPLSTSIFGQDFNTFKYGFHLLTFGGALILTGISSID